MRIVVSFLSLICFSQFSMAQGGSQDYGQANQPAPTVEPFKIHALSLGVGLNVSRTKGLAEAGYGLATGAKYSFFFSPKVGVFTGVDYTQRSGAENGAEFSMPSLDIPLGLTFRYRNMLDGESATYLGAYYALPLTGEADDGTSTVELEGEGHFGFLLHTETYFPVTPEFNLGFFAGFKFGFGDAVTEVDGIASPDNNTALDINLGLAARF